MKLFKLVLLGLIFVIVVLLVLCGKIEFIFVVMVDVVVRFVFDQLQIKIVLIFFNSVDLDLIIVVCMDFNGFVNSKWFKVNLVFNDQIIWGSFEILCECLLEVQYVLVQQVVVSQVKVGLVEVKIGDIWKIGLDEVKIEVVGIVLLQLQLDKIVVLKDIVIIVQYLCDSQVQGQGVLFLLFGNVDYKDLVNVIVYVG